MKCRNGHDSATNDFCSECGLEMDGAAAAGAFDADATPVPKHLCPVCASDRDDLASPFCGVCGYNFITKAGGNVVTPSATPPPPAPPIAKKPPPPVAPPAPNAPPPAANAPRIEIEVSFDAAKAEAPKNQPPRKFSLYDEECLLGRRTSSVAQTLGLDGDDFISRRHLLIIRQKTGYVARLFDNTNGGALNGKDLTPGVEMPLKVDDILSIGSYTLIRVVSVRT